MNTLCHRKKREPWNYVNYNRNMPFCCNFIAFGITQSVFLRMWRWSLQNWAVQHNWCLHLQIPWSFDYLRWRSKFSRVNNTSNQIFFFCAQLLLNSSKHSYYCAKFNLQVKLSSIFIFSWVFVEEVIQIDLVFFYSIWMLWIFSMKFCIILGLMP